MLELSVYEWNTCVVRYRFCMYTAKDWYRKYLVIWSLVYFCVYTNLFLWAVRFGDFFFIFVVAFVALAWSCYMTCYNNGNDYIYFKCGGDKMHRANEYRCILINSTKWSRCFTIDTSMELDFDFVFFSFFLFSSITYLCFFHINEFIFIRVGNSVFVHFE